MIVPHIICLYYGHHVRATAESKEDTDTSWDELVTLDVQFDISDFKMTDIKLNIHRHKKISKFKLHSLASYTNFGC